MHDKTFTGIQGLDAILGNSAFPPEEAEHGYRVLIRGLPGTGKTTLGIHVLQHQLVQLTPTLVPNEPSKGLIVYYQEAFQELDYIALQFQVLFKQHPPDTYRMPAEEFEELSFLKFWLQKRQDGEKLCILIDGLSLLRTFEFRRTRKYLTNLLSIFPRKNLLLIIIAEEDLTGGDHFFEHMVDGVINLSVDNGSERHRFLEISKLRYIDYVRGRHGFEMYKHPDTGFSTLRVYPRPSCHFIRISDLERTGNLCRVKPNGIESGIKGLDEILCGSPTTGVLEKGDVVVITAEPGTEKLGMGLSFLFPVAACQDATERGLWVSFEPTAFEQYEPLLKAFERDKENRKDVSTAVTEITRRSLAMHPDRIVSDLVANLVVGTTECTTPLTRVVIYGLSNLGREFEDSARVQEYTVWLARILKKCNAVSMIFVDLPQSFQPIGNIPMEWGEVADFVGHLRWFELNNQLNMTFVLTKSRFANFRSVPHYVGHVKEEPLGGMLLEDRGWPMVSMLSGRMDTIHETKVFLKFFDQNYSARAVHALAFNEFRGRYPDDHIFKHVFRTTPSPKHWSFRGYAGAGHSNTKVVCLKQYIMQVLESDEVLVQIPTDEWEKYPIQTDDKLPDFNYRKARSYSLWGLACRGKSSSKQPPKMIPLYADIGVLCAQTDVGALIEKSKKEVEGDVEVREGVPRKIPKTWDEMFEENERFLEMKNKAKENNKIYHPPWIEHLFALPSLTTDVSGFMAFFLEILIDQSEKSNDEIFDELRKYGLKHLIESKAFDKTIDLLRRMVREGVSRTPLERTHYHTAYFARRWFSKIDQYPDDDPRRPEIEMYLRRKDDPLFNERELKRRFNFSIYPLPTDVRGNPFGFSCLEFYSLGLIRQALAPETAWMFISELASHTRDVIRFEQRRGLPIPRENWIAPRENLQSQSDISTIDRILNEDKFFCNFWIPKYWYIESRVVGVVRKIFVGIAEDVDVAEVEPKVEDIRDEFLKILAKL